MPIRNGYADEVIIITSGEKMALFAAKNIKEAVAAFHIRNNVDLMGVILNQRNVPNEREIVEDFVAEQGTRLIGVVPRDDAIQLYENQNMTVIEGDVNLSISKKILEIADSIIRNEFE